MRPECGANRRKFGVAACGVAACGVASRWDGRPPPCPELHSPAVRFGVCYYPEQWPEERWPVDARMMAKMGLDLVRIGEFAWAGFEPERGRFVWDWLDRAIDTITSHGLGIVLCTPTATPPVWLVQEQPTVLSVGPDGRRRAYGSRRHTCVTSTVYRDEAKRIVGELLGRYGHHEMVVAWQVDNEMGNHDSARCWCPECQSAFTRWLNARFGTIDELNKQWGTIFWSQTYPDFESVLLPVPAMTSHNPSLLMAHRKFASEQAVDFLGEQIRLIRSQVAPNVEVTTNFYSEDTPVDQRAAARLTGIASIDSYPHGPNDPLVTAYHLDLALGSVGREGTAWVMEQQAGPINWTQTNPPVADGQVRVWTWQAALHGFDALLYFRWRAARFGQEMYHSGLLRHDGSPTAVVAEVTKTIDEIRLAGAFDRPRPRVAILHSYKDVWAIEINPHRIGTTHRSMQMDAYAAARRLGLEVALVDSEDDLTDFDWVLAPVAHITTPERIASIIQALDSGTGVVLGPRSFVMTREYAWSDLPLPAGLTDRLGARVAEHLSQNQPVTVSPWGTAAGLWTDVLNPQGAEVIATYGGGTYLDGRAAAVRQAGLVYAGFSNVDSWTALLGDLMDLRPVSSHLEVFVRGDRRYIIDHMALTIETAGK